MSEEQKAPVYVFHYDRNTRVYTGYDEAHESPREPGVYHVPAFATLKEPPLTSVNTYAWFNVESGVWILRERQTQDEAPAPKSWLERVKAFMTSTK